MASVVSPLTTRHPRDAYSASDFVRHRFSVQQYRDMIEHGIFAEDEPIELICGEVVRKMPIGNAHAAMVKQLNRLFSLQIPPDLLVSIQDPIATADSEPEPDVALLNYCDDYYASRRPLAKDVRLLIEVSDSSLVFDREIKGAVYAAAGIVEYWIVNLNNSTVEIYLDPQPAEGRYATNRTLRRGEALTPLTTPSVTLTLEAIFDKAR